MEETFGLEIIDTTPKELAYEGYANYTYSLWFALGELIDNSITSAYKNWDRLSNQVGGNYRLQVRVTIDQSRDLVSVIDNAAGITLEEFKNVLVAGTKPSDSSLLSIHGKGLKIAAFWWGRQLTVTSTPLGKDYTSFAVMDLDAMALKGDANATAEKRVPPQPLPGTAIKFTKAYKNRWPDAKAMNGLTLLLASMYRSYMTDSERPLDLYLNDQKVIFEYFPLLQAPFWNTNKAPLPGSVSREWRRNDFQMVTSSGHTISGWYGILSQMKRDLSGFFLHFRGKGMEGLGYANHAAGDEDSGSVRESNQYFRPREIFGQDGSPRFGRFTGEFDLSAFGKPAQSNAPEWSDQDKEEFIAAILADMKRGPESFWTMADKYAARAAKALASDDQDIKPKEISELGAVLFNGWSGDSLVHSNAEIESIEPDEALSDAENIVTNLIEFVRVHDAEEHEHLIVLELVSAGADLGLYSLKDESSADNDRHVLRLNVGHPLLSKLNWASKYTRNAAVTMTLLMALPELYLPARINRSSFRVKINEFAALLAEDGMLPATDITDD